MNTYDIAIVGSGMGGAMIASLQKSKSVIVFEKDRNLGGCASTFCHLGSWFNAGATTLVGYEEGHVLKHVFSQSCYEPELIPSDVAIQVIQNKTTLNRCKDFSLFIQQINELYPNKNNEKFWRKMKKMDEAFWNLKQIYFAKYSFKGKLKTAAFIKELLLVYGWDIFRSAKGYIQSVLGDICIEYQNFIDAQLLITVQTTSKEIPLLSMALGLSYPFHDVFYVKDGMGSIVEGLLQDVDVHRHELVLDIQEDKKGFKLSTNKEVYFAKKVVLNSTIYDSASLFRSFELKKYYHDFAFSNQSAFVVYVKLNVNLELLHHYQIILKQTIPNAISNSFFVSVSQGNDRLSQGGLSLTISTHTQANIWKIKDEEIYHQKKQETQDFILDALLQHINDIKKENIRLAFSATSHTFNSYINRYNCGGKAIGFKNFMQLPSCDTPFKGIFQVGDTVFAGQGWPGVAVGSWVLNQEMNTKEEGKE